MKKGLEMERVHKRDFAVVLSGGGLRSAAQIGVLKTLEEYGIRPDCMIGTSGGAIVSALYASGLTAGEIEDLYLAVMGREDEFIDPALGQLWKALISLDISKIRGLVKGAKLQNFIEKQLKYIRHFAEYDRLSGDSRDRVLDLYLTAVNINDGTEVVFCPPRAVRSADYGSGLTEARLCSDISISEAVRASISIPGVFTPFKHGADHFVDGGLRDNLPLQVAVKLAGASKVLAVDLGYAGLRQEDLVANGVVDLLSQSIDIMAMDQLAADLYDPAIANGRVIILNPLIYDVGLLDTQHIPAMIKRGQLLAEAFCRSKGLRRGVVHTTLNRALLFEGVTKPVLYPAKGTPVYALLRKQISESNPLPQKTSLADKIGLVLKRFGQKFRLAAGILLIITGGVFVWGDPVLLQAVGVVAMLAGLVIVYMGRGGRSFQLNR